jgi:hypothetical protein
VNPPVSTPVAVIVHVGGGVAANRAGTPGTCIRVHIPVGKSAGKKKAPETVTTVPGLPEVGLTVSTGVTINGNREVTEVLLGFEVRMIGMGPRGAEGETMKEPVAAPPENEHEDDVTRPA